MPDIIVLGAGIVGVATALQLRLSGADVLLVSKGTPQDAASFGNAGIIQAEAVAPYAFPRGLGTVLSILAGRDNSVHYTLRGLLPHAAALFAYWRHSSPRRHAAITRTYARLIAHAQDDHAALIARAGAEHLVRKTGYLEIYRDAAALDAAATAADAVRAAHGVDSRRLDLDAVARLEPHLDLRSGGAIHYTEPWSVTDPGALVAAYLDAFRAAGGTFAQGDAATLARDGSGWSVRLTGGRATARHAVLALGAATPAQAARFGHRFPLVPKRGYHAHLPAGNILTHPVHDAANATVLVPMAKGLRVITGAAFTHRPDAPSPQLARSLALAAELTGCSDTPLDAPWTGVRPCMPDMLPVMGESSRQAGLWFHFGHGHQGLTLGPTTARLLAGAILGNGPVPEVAHALSPGRFR